MLLGVRPLLLLACTAVAFFTLSRAPGAVNFRRQEGDLTVTTRLEANSIH